MEYTLNSRGMSYTISTRGAELIRVRDSEGQERMHIPTAGGWERVSPLLFPLCGRLREGRYTYGGREYTLPGHGFLPTSETEVVAAGENTLTLRLQDSEQTLAVYPFPFRLEVTYTALGNTLRTETVIRNVGLETMPYMFGGHPGVRLPLSTAETPRSCLLDLGACEIRRYPVLPGGLIGLSAETMRLPGGRMSYDPDWIDRVNTAVLMGTGHTITLSDGEGRHGVTLTYGEEFPYLCLWKEIGCEDYLCLEPWSDVPSDGTQPERFESRRMHRLLPGVSATYCYQLTFF